jgi:DNA-binding MarR family transcriptional regulator
MSEEPPARRITTALAKLGLAVKTNAWRQGARLGLTPTQAQALAVLQARGRPCRLREVAVDLGVRSATASDAVAALARKGLVTSSPADDDQRARAIALTTRGERVAEQVATWPDFLVAAAGLLSPPEQAVFLRGLMRMIRHLQEERRVPVARMCVSCRYFRPHAHPDPFRPHHCAFVDAPFGDLELRFDCRDHQAAAPDQAASSAAALDGATPAIPEGGSR